METNNPEFDLDAYRMEEILRVVTEQYVWKVCGTDSPDWKRMYNKHYFTVLVNLIEELKYGE